MTRTIPPQCVAIVKKYESFVPTVYKDSIGIDTVGFGHVVRPGESFSTITEEQAEELLAGDLSVRAATLEHYIKSPLNDNQFSAVLSLVFNCGVAPLVGHLGTYLNAQQYNLAADEFVKWIFAAGHKLPGLLTRREAERTLFLSAC
jgi:lysozyme